MRRNPSTPLSWLFIAIITVALAACSPKASPTLDVLPPPSETDWDDLTYFRQGLITSEQESLDLLMGATVYHIEFQISDDFFRLTGQEEVRYTNRESEPLNEIYFRLFPNITGGSAAVAAVRVDDQEVDPIYELQNSALRLPLPKALQPNTQTIIQMDFIVEVAREMGGNYGLFGYFDDVLVLDMFYPVIPVYDEEGWNVELPSRNGDIGFFDASFYLVEVTASSDVTIVASGVEIGREREANHQIQTFAVGPARDFYLAASDRFSLVSETLGETTINSYSISDQPESAEFALQVAIDALASFNARIGIYPYTEFDVVSTPMQALGIEYPGIVGVGVDLYDPKKEISGLPSSVLLESTVAHEVAHQLFYNVIGNDQVDEPWLDEATAQYATFLYYNDVQDSGAAQGFISSWNGRWERVNMAKIPIGLPAGDYVGLEYGAIVYGRGPLFIVALADEMGQTAFDEFLHTYYESHKWGIGTSESFKQLAESHCQCDLSPLFEEWVYQK